MPDTAAPPEFATWSAPGHSRLIEYSAAALEQIRYTAVDGYHRVPHGGVETGGILFGTHTNELVRITAWREIACEYAKGPSFLLSERDEEAFAESLEQWRGDSGSDRLEPVGWYRAHTRSEICLSDADLAFFDRFFPEPWQVGLIVRPASFAPTRAGFFFREPDGHIRAQSSYFEFAVLPVTVDPPPALEAPPAPAELVPEPVPEPVSADVLPARGMSARWFWYAAALILLVCAVLAFWLLRPIQRTLTLSAADAGGQLRITWDGRAAWLGHATSGSMDIYDRGVRTHVTLGPADLRSGKLFYARQSGDIGVRLTVRSPGNPPVVETARFLGPGGKAAAPPEPVEIAKPLAPPQQSGSSPAHVGPALPRPVIPFRAPAESARPLAADVPSIAPPAIDNVPAVPPAGLTPVLKSVAAPTPAPAAATPPAAIRTAGRIIWTGRLSKNGRLIVERNHASTGAVSGSLPTMAARVSAFPGDLTDRGITIFTADTRYSQAMTEEAGAENGWNATTYTWDPKRAGGIRIVEQPETRNGYRLVLQSDLPQLSVLMLEWRATP